MEKENNVFYAHFLKDDIYYCLSIPYKNIYTNFNYKIKEELKKIINYNGPFIISKNNNTNFVSDILFIYGDNCEFSWGIHNGYLTNLYNCIPSDHIKQVYDIKNILEIIQYENWEECIKNNIYVKTIDGNISDPDYDKPQPQIKQLYVHYIDRMSNTVSHCKYENYDSSKLDSLYPTITSDSNYLKTSTICKIIPPFNFFIRDRNLEILSGDNISITNITSFKYWKLNLNGKLYNITDFKDIFDLIDDARHNFLNVNPCREQSLPDYHVCQLGLKKYYLHTKFVGGYYCDLFYFNEINNTSKIEEYIKKTLNKNPYFAIVSESEDPNEYDKIVYSFGRQNNWVLSNMKRDNNCILDNKLENKGIYIDNINDILDIVYKYNTFFEIKFYDKSKYESLKMII